jgi:glutathione peroxidase
MKKLFISILLVFSSHLQAASESDLFYSQNLNTLEGKKYSFTDLKGKAVLIVNTASQCGFTPQLQDLETINKKYAPRGLVILAIPSNDFKQESGSSQEILNFAKKEFKTTFTFLEKQKITGENKSNLFRYLTSQKKNALFTEVQWNFEKFLIDKNGKVVERWSSITKPTSESLTQKIEDVLK